MLWGVYGRFEKIKHIMEADSSSLCTGFPAVVQYAIIIHVQTSEYIHVYKKVNCCRLFDNDVNKIHIYKSCIVLLIMENVNDSFNSGLYNTKDLFARQATWPLISCYPILNGSCVTHISIKKISECVKKFGNFQVVTWTSCDWKSCCPHEIYCYPRQLGLWSP